MSGSLTARFFSAVVSRDLISNRFGAPPSTVTIDLAELDRNARILRGVVPAATRVCAVVKNNAFGHGIGRVAEAISRHVDMFGVVDNWEAHEIRSVGIRHPILRVRCASPAELYDAPHGVEEVTSLQLVHTCGRCMHGYCEVLCSSRPL